MLCSFAVHMFVSDGFLKTTGLTEVYEARGNPPVARVALRVIMRFSLS